jgi:4-amino-4-deoxy-L-arabinose transferase-like glycosyltransferase
MKNKNFFPCLLITIVASLFFIPFLGSVHLFDWDEINFAECAREMLVSGNYSVVQINFEPFWEKPPLFIWMQAMSMKIFGINEFAARFPNAICGIITLPVLFHIGQKILGTRFGILWAVSFFGSLLTHFYFKSAIIDPWFNLFIFLGIYHIILFLNNPVYTRHIVFSAFFIGLAILTKGPVALLIFLLCVFVFWVSKRFHLIVSAKNIFAFVIVLILTGGSWFLYLIFTGQSSVLIDFILYQIRLLTTADSGHSGFLLYHFWILLLGVFPASVFALPNIFPKISFFSRKKNDTPFQTFFSQWMRILFWVVLILFSLVRTKIIHYSSLCYFPLTFFAAYTIEQHLNNPECSGWKKWFRITFAVVGIFLGIVFIFSSFIENYKMQLIQSGIIKDTFAVENLKADVHWLGWEWSIGVLWLLLIIVWLVIFKKYSVNFRLYLLYFGISAVLINLLILVIAPKVEQYTQGAAIEFFQNKKDENAVIETIGYKSFAQYFYTQHKESTKHFYPGKKYYFVSKITAQEKVRSQCIGCEELYRKNGFVFWKQR